MRGQGVRLLVQPETVRLCPGEHMALALTIDNLGRLPAACRLSVRGLPREWYGLDAECVALAPEGSARQTLALHLPPDAIPALGRYPFQVEAAAEGGPRATAIVNLWVQTAHQAPLDAPSEGADPASEGGAPASASRRWGPPKSRVTAPRWAVAGVILGLLVLLLGVFALPRLRRPPAPGRAPAAAVYPPRSSAPAVRSTQSPVRTVRAARAVVRRAPTAALAPRSTRRRSLATASRPRRYAQAQVLLVPSAISIVPHGARQNAATHLVRLVNLGPQRLTIVRISLSPAAHSMFDEHDTCAGRTIPAYRGCVIRLRPRRPRERARASLIAVDTPLSNARRVLVVVR